MDFYKSITVLINSACPSIQYRVRKEILQEDINTPIMKNLQNKILQDERIKELIELQQEDGWIGGGFHGEKEPESAIRYLREKGVEGNNHVIDDALNAIINKGVATDDEALSFGVGKHLDLHHLGGTQMVKACVFGYAGHEEVGFVQEQVKEAMAAFEYVASLDSLEQIYHKHKEKVNIFNNGTKWPSTYHLRLLAHTNAWRNEENEQILIEAFNKLVDFSPIPPIKLLYKSQIMAPASIYIDDFDVEIDKLSAKEWMMWFHRTEMIARLGIANDVPQIKKQIDCLQEYIIENEGFFVKPLSHFYFTKWTQYIGLSLENDWKAKGARLNDLTFRSLLIMKLTSRL